MYREKEDTQAERNTDLFEQHPHLVAISDIATPNLIPAAILQWEEAMQWSGSFGNVESVGLSSTRALVTAQLVPVGQDF